MLVCNLLSIYLINLIIHLLKKYREDKENLEDEAKSLEALEAINLKEQQIPKLEEDDQYFCSIKADEVPQIPENKFLLRRAPEPAAPKNEQESTKPKQDEKEHDRNRDRGEHRNYKDAVGRKVKGRGALRYNGRSRSRSRTPPHWRRANEDRQRFGYQNQAYGSSSFGQAKAQPFVRGKEDEIKKENKRDDDKDERNKRDEQHRERDKRRDRDRDDFKDKERDYDKDRNRKRSQERYAKTRDEIGKYKYLSLS